MTPTSRSQLITEGVVASYIHDISARTATSATARRNGNHVHGRASRLAHTRAALRGRDARPRRGERERIALPH
jgi:predicted Zn-dependent protease